MSIVNVIYRYFGGMPAFYIMVQRFWQSLLKLGAILGYFYM
jgi:hypothetical protein